MTNLKKLTMALAVVVTVCAYLPQDAEATGLLRRWWQRVRGRNTTAACCPTAQQTVLRPAVTPNINSLKPGQCMRTCQKTCSRTVVNYVPQTAFRTAYKRVPVTQYRPETTTDPCTGCTVTCMKPCTTFTYQCQRVPYTTYKPVYRTQTYKVPVTTITNGCSTGTCGTCSTGTCSTGTCPTVANFAPQTGCSTCGVSNAAPAQNFSPGGSTTTQTFTIDPSTGSTVQGGSSFAPTPADQQPILNLPSPTPGGSGSRNDFTPTTVPDVQQAFNGLTNPQTAQRPVLNQFDPSNRTTTFKASAPVPAFEQLRPQTVVEFDGHTAENPVRRSWDYSPVRFASTALPTERRMTVFAGKVGIEADAPKQVRKSRWVEVE